MCRTLSASRRGWMKWRPGPRSRYLSDSLLSLSHKSAFYSVHSTAASHRSLKSGHRVGVGGSWRWHVGRELLMRVHLAVILTDTLTRCMSRWPDKHSTATWTAACLVRCGMRAKRRNDWMTPARAQPMARPLCPGSVGKPPSPLPQAVPQNPGRVLHGCDTSLCKPFSAAETCLLWLFWPLCTESRSQHANFTCCQCSCFISGQVCSRPLDSCSHPGKNLFPVCCIGPGRAQQPCRTQTFRSTFSEFLDELHIWHRRTTQSIELRDRQTFSHQAKEDKNTQRIHD